MEQKFYPCEFCDTHLPTIEDWDKHDVVCDKKKEALLHLSSEYEQTKKLERRIKRYEKFLVMISDLGARENVFPRELGELADKALSDKE